MYGFGVRRNGLSKIVSSCVCCLLLEASNVNSHVLYGLGEHIKTRLMSHRS